MTEYAFTSHKIGTSSIIDIHKKLTSKLDLQQRLILTEGNHNNPIIKQRINTLQLLIKKLEGVTLIDTLPITDLELIQLTILHY